MLQRLLSIGIAFLLCFTMLPTQLEAEESLPVAVEEAFVQWQEEVLARYADIPALQLDFTQESEAVKERYLRVDFRCTVSREGLSHPLELEQSFHVSIQSGKLLDLEDLLIHGGAERLQRELAEETGSDTSIVNWKLTEEGLTLYPSRGIGTSGLELTEDVLSQVLIWDGSVMWPNRPCSP